MGVRGQYGRLIGNVRADLWREPFCSKTAAREAAQRSRERLESQRPSDGYMTSTSPARGVDPKMKLINANSLLVTCLS